MPATSNYAPPLSGFATTIFNRNGRQRLWGLVFPRAQVIYGVSIGSIETGAGLRSAERERIECGAPQSCGMGERSGVRIASAHAVLRWANEIQVRATRLGAADRCRRKGG